jgi:hypothetical protein
MKLLKTVLFQINSIRHSNAQASLPYRSFAAELYNNSSVTKYKQKKNVYRKDDDDSSVPRHFRLLLVATRPAVFDGADELELDADSDGKATA